MPTGLYIANAFDWHAAFYFICLIGVIFWVLAFLILPSVDVKSEHKTLSQKIQNFKSILIQKDYLEAFALTSVLGFGVFSIVPFIAPYMVRNVGLLESELPLIYLIGGIGTIITARIIGKLCDKIGSYKVFRVVAVISVFPIFGLTNLPAGTHIALALTVTSLFTMFGSGRLS